MSAEPKIQSGVVGKIKSLWSNYKRLCVVAIVVVVGSLIGACGGSHSSRSDAVLEAVYPQIHNGMTIGNARDLSKDFERMKYVDLGTAMGITAYRWRGKTMELRLMTDYRNEIVNKVLESYSKR